MTDLRNLLRAIFLISVWIAIGASVPIAARWLPWWPWPMVVVGLWWCWAVVDLLYGRTRGRGGR